MDVQRAGRVIVGIHPSLTGLRALREATEEARRRGAELCAVRAYPPPHAATGFDYTGTSGISATCGRPWAQSAAGLVWAGRRREAGRTVSDAFDEAMGGPPPDVSVRMLTVDGRPHRALVRFASRDDDLLVVGASRRRVWWPFRRSVGRYCATRATCPVLVVPPHEAAREMSGRVRWRSLEQELTDDTSVPRQA